MSVTVKELRDEVNLERWDKKGIPVLARIVGEKADYPVVGFRDDGDAFVLDLEAPVKEDVPETEECGE